MTDKVASIEKDDAARRLVVAIPDYLQKGDIVSARRSMTEALVAAGLVPVVLPEMDEAGADLFLSRCDAVMIGGGIKDQDYDRRCAFEDIVIALAVRRGLPIAGICHGCQVINRHFGGTLAPVPAGREIIHKDPALFERGLSAEHFATVLPAPSLMAAVFGEGRLQINSSHTMRCDKPAPGCRGTAVSEEDGVIEAIEHESLPIAAFQFHPEKYWTKDKRFLELIRRALAPFPLTTSH